MKGEHLKTKILSSVPLMQVEVRLVGFSLTATFSSIDGTRHPEFEGLAGLSGTSLKPHQCLHLCVTR